MLQRGLLLLCLLVASLVASTTVHASELPGRVTIECAGAVHGDNEQEQAPADTDKGVAHHHGCHSVSSFVPAQPPASHAFARPVALFMPGFAAALTCRHPGPDLRPPIA